ncbi:MAG TPA: DUF4012 domain-containing protein [Candidatus Lumbricidophila sp.]|nr:DUF4012 domain-containing protein [Candidatus Lumbricidophila sp.]
MKFHAIFWPIAVLVLAAAGAAAFGLYQSATSVKSHLESAEHALTAFKTAATNKQFAQLPGIAATVEHESDAAKAASNTWLWKVGTQVPVLGENLRAVGAVTDSVQQVSHEVVTPAASLLGDFTLARDPATGKFNLDIVRKARTLLGTTERVVGDVQARLAGVNTKATVGQVSQGVDRVRKLVDEASEMVPGLNNALNVVADLIGANGPRNVVLAFLNNAESAPLGGGPAAQALLSVADGKVEITKQVSSGDFDNRDHPVDAPATSDELALYDEILLAHINGSLSIPDFPKSAAILRAWWNRDIGIDPDLVITLDPIGLAKLLKVTGPVKLADGTTITSDNVVLETLNQVYFRYPNGGPASDAFFGSIAEAIFTRLTNVDYDVWKMADAISQSANGGSLHIWAKDSGIQEQLSKLSAAGIMPTDNAAATSLGIYFRDRSASKIDTYLHTSAKVTTNVCKPDAPTYTIEVTLKFDIPKGLRLPAYVDSGLYDFYRTEVFLYGPVGASLTDKSVQEVAIRAPSIVKNDLGRPVVKFTSDQENGDTVVLRATFTGAPGQYGPTTARVTPMINTSQVTYETAPCG